MTDPSDSAANLAFYFGGATGDVYLANVKLFSPAPGDFNTDGTVNWLDLSILGDAWLKQQSGLSSDLDKNGIINFNDFRVMGGNWGAGAP